MNKRVIISLLLLWPSVALARVYTPITPTEAPDFGNFSTEQQAEYERLFSTPGIDSDGDGFTDLQELLATTASDDPNDTPERINLALSLQPDPTIDSDNDGFPDQTEHALGTDPWDETSVPAQNLVLVPTLAPTLETQFHKDLASLVHELDYDPVRIYRFVHDEIRFEEYDHSAKGAVATLHTRLGNEWDQAALLVTLLRMSGIPARFGRSGLWNHILQSKDKVYMRRPVVFVQAWATPGMREGAQRNPTFASPSWIPLVPHLKTMTVVSEGIDLFPQASDGTTKSPVDWMDILENYLLGAPDVANLDAFISHTQLTPVDFFEAWLHDFLAETSCEGEDADKPQCLLGRPPTLSDIPRKQQIVPFEGKTLPHSFPYGPSSHEDDASTFDQIPMEQRQFVDLKLEVIYGNAGAGNASAPAPKIQRRFYTSQMAERRLVLDPAGNVANDRADVVLRLDGRAIEPPFPNLSMSEDRIQTTHTVRGGLPKPRPPLAARAIITYSFGLRSGSMARAAELAEELADMDYSVAVSENDEPFIGRFGALMAETFHTRELETNYRVDSLLHVITPTAPTTMMVWTYPDTIPRDIEPSELGLGSAFLLHPAWFFDIQSHPHDSRKHNFPLADSLDPPPWPTHPHLPRTAELHQLRKFVVSATGSFHEGSIIEQWAGTPALSTVLGMFHANEVVKIEQSDVSTEEKIAEVSQRLAALGTGTIANILAFLRSNPDGFVWAPTSPPQRIDPEDPNNVLLEVPLYAGFSSRLMRWAGNGNFHFGAGQNEIDKTVTTAFERDIAEIGNFDGDWSNSIVPDRDVFYLPNESFANIHPAGDPVNLVTGEFYTEEIPDLTFKSYGELDFSITRGYRSQAQYPGPFGYGWTWNHSESLWFEDEGALRHVHYNDARRQDHYLEHQNDGSYKLPAGITYTFEPVGTDAGAPSQYRLTQKDGTVILFDTLGRLQRKFDRFGNFLTFLWDLSNERLSRIEDQRGRGLDFIYEGNNTKVSKVVCDFAPAEKCTVEYYYDDISGEDLVRFVNAEGHSTRFEYLTNQDHPLNNHNLIKYILPNDEFLEISYAKNDRVLSHTNSQGKTFKFRYSPVNHSSETWDESIEWGKEGNHEMIFYDSNHNVIRHDVADGNIRTMIYDDSHNLTKETDALGNATTYTYDGNRNIRTQTNALGEIWEWRYEDPTHPNFATWVRDPEGGIIENQHKDNRLIRQIAHLTKDNAAIALEHISFDEIPDTLLPGSTLLQERITKTSTMAVPRLVVDYEHDEVGNVRFITSRLMEYVVESGDLVEIPGLTQRDTSVVEHRYDVDNLLRVKTLNPNNFATTFAHDELGRVDKVIDPEGHVEEIERNNLHQLAERRSSYLGVVEKHEYDELSRVYRSTDAVGAVTEFVYHPIRDIVHQDQIAKKIDPLTYEESFEYDPVGNLTSMTNANGDARFLTYDSMKRLIYETDFAGHETHHEYDGVGNRIATTDALGRRTAHQYDEANRRVATIDPAGRITTFQYDKNGNLVESIDVLGTLTSIQRDALGREIGKTEGVNLESPRIQRRVFDGLGRILYEVDPLGTEHHRTYDAAGRVKTERWVDTNGLTVRKRSYEYDKRDLVVKEIDGRGSEHYMHYDPAGRLIGESDPDPDAPGERIKQTYVLDSAGRITYAENGEGFGTTTTYSKRGEIISVEDANGYTVTFAYDGNGNTVRQTDELGLETTHVYNARNELVETVDHAGGVTRRYYDAVGNPIGSETATGRFTETKVDELDRVATQIDEIGNETAIQYLDDRNVHTTQVITTDRRGNPTTQTFNGFGDLIRVSAPEQLIIQYRHDGLGNVTEIHSENASGPTILSYFYDALGRRRIAQDDDGSQRVTIYDPEGNLAKEILQNDQIVDHHYDSLDRLRKVIVANVLGEQGILEQEFAYDRRSLLKRAVDHNGQRISHETLIDYDPAGRPVTETHDGVAIRKTLDGRGQETWVGQPELSFQVERNYGARRATYSYTQIRRRTVMKTAIKPGGVLPPAVYGYVPMVVAHIDRSLDAEGRLESHSSFPFTRTVEYGPRGNLALQSYHRHNQLVFQDSITEQDNELNITERVQSRGTNFLSDPILETHRDSFTYDNQNRLISMNSADRELYLSWFHDPLGNWKTQTINSVTTERSINGDNEYNGIGSFQPEYDKRGNLLRPYNNRTFHYDWNNRLTQVIDTATQQVVASYSYDALGRRRQKIAGDDVTKYFTNADNQVVYVDSAHSYTLGYIDGIPVFMGDFPNCRPSEEECEPTKNYLMTDHLGSVVGSVQTDHSEPHTVSYDAYGNVLSVGGQPGADRLEDNQLGFGGALWDAHAQVWHFPFREYDPQEGRFLQRDPREHVDGLNTYAFVRNNPMNRVDPLGLTSRPSGSFFSSGIDLASTNKILAQQAGITDPFTPTFDPVVNTIDAIGSSIANHPVSLENVLQDTGNFTAQASKFTPRMLLQKAGINVDFLKVNVDIGLPKVQVGGFEVEGFLSFGLDGADIEGKVFAPNLVGNFGGGIKAEFGILGEGAGEFYLGPYGKHENGTAKTSFEMRDLADNAAPIIKQEIKRFSIGAGDAQAAIGTGVVKVKVGADLAKIPGADRIVDFGLGVREFFTGERMIYNEKGLREGVDRRAIPPRYNYINTSRRR